MKIRQMLSLFAVLLMSACSTVTSEYPLPVQDCDPKAALPTGTTAVFFYNDTNPALFADGSWRIGVELDGVGVTNLDLKEYVRVNLVPKTYRLGLSHRDVFLFQNTYDLRVGGRPLHVRVYNCITSTKYEVMTSEPVNFRHTHRPVRSKSIRAD